MMTQGHKTERVAPVAIPEHEYLEERHNLIVDLGLFAEQEESTDIENVEQLVQRPQRA
jgi:hypothetical protein